MRHRPDPRDITTGRLIGLGWLLLFAVGTLPAAEPVDPTALTAAERAALTETLAELDQAVAAGPEAATPRFRRAVARFQAGDFAGSAADFDAVIAADPDAADGLWQRGISCYYAGRYADGAAQFGRYVRHDAGDVENSVWHYLCRAKVVGRDAARAEILSVAHDPRVPLDVILKLFQGTATEADVRAAMADGAPTGDEAARRTFYGELYLGLWADSEGRPDAAIAHLTKAAAVDPETPGVSGYMHDVARIHARWLKAKPEAATPATR